MLADQYLLHQCPNVRIIKYFGRYHFWLYNKLQSECTQCSYVCMCVCVSVYVCVSMYVCKCVYMCVSICVYVCVHVCVVCR